MLSVHRLLKTCRHAALALLLPGVLVSPVAHAGHKPADPTQFISYQLEIKGAVKQPQLLNLAALHNFPAQQIDELPLICQSGANVGKLEKLRGVKLTDLLNKAVINAPGHNDVKKMLVIATATDGYKVVFSWSELFNSATGDAVLVFFEKNGLPLTADEGMIALISAKDLSTGPRHVKWLSQIEVRKID